MRFKHNKYPFLSKKVIIVILIIPGCLLLFIKHLNLSFPYRVKEVIDGDTIRLENHKIIRYIGLDTPELREKIKDEWIYSPRPFAEKAKSYNEKLVNGKVIKLKTDIQKIDNFGRILAYVYPVKEDFNDKNTNSLLSFWNKIKIFFNFTNKNYADDKMINVQILEKGYGVIYVCPPNLEHLEDFVKAQKKARKNKRGVWQSRIMPISYGDAKFHIGEIISIKGKIRNIKSKNKVIVLDFNKNKKFSLVIFKSNLKLFKNENILINNLLDKNVEAFGMVKLYNNMSQIVIHHPCQLKIIE